MKRFFFVVLVLSSVALAGTVRTRAWCKHPAHGKNPRGGYAWISEMFVGTTSDECWKYSKGHEQRDQGHYTGCSYVKENGEFR